MGTLLKISEQKWLEKKILNSKVLFDKQDLKTILRLFPSLLLWKVLKWEEIGWDKQRYDDMSWDVLLKHWNLMYMLKSRNDLASDFSK